MVYAIMFILPLPFFDRSWSFLLRTIDRRRDRSIYRSIIHSIHRSSLFVVDYILRIDHHRTIRVSPIPPWLHVILFTHITWRSHCSLSRYYHCHTLSREHCHITVTRTLFLSIVPIRIRIYHMLALLLSHSLRSLLSHPTRSLYAYSIVCIGVSLTSETTME